MKDKYHAQKKYERKRKDKREKEIREAGYKSIDEIVGEEDPIFEPLGRRTGYPGTPPFRAIKNLVAQEAVPMPEPWEYEPDIPDDVRTKDEFRRWVARKSTNHAFISGMEGLNSGLRVSGNGAGNKKEGAPDDTENPIWSMGALIADYDSPLIENAGEHINKVLADIPELRPQWIVKTAARGYARLVWIFEERIGLGGAGPALLPHLIAILKKQFRLNALLAGLDTAALENPSTYYEIGAEWTELCPRPVPATALRRYFAEAVKKTATGSNAKAPSGKLPEIPMAAIAEAIERTYPGRWPIGVPFEEGCRGPAVWDPSASNPTSCIWTKHGVYRYSSDRIFHPYSEIFGKSFVRDYEISSIHSVVGGDVYYAGRAGYYRKFGNGEWVSQATQDVVRWMNVKGISTAAKGKGLPSPADEALLVIQEAYRVDGAVPLPYLKHSKDGPVQVNGRVFLNSARITPVKPAGVAVPGVPPSWGDGFPFMAKWLIGLFNPRTSLVRFLYWFKLAYEGALNDDMQPSLALFIAGGMGSGKTLLNMRVIGDALGGGADATNYLVHGSQFNKGLLEVAHWHIDDAEATSSNVNLARYTEKLKHVIANPAIPYRPMYVDEQMVPRAGTICVTLNTDADSLRLVPDLGRNITDKLLLLRAHDADDGVRGHDGFRFPPRAQTEATIRKELPFFLRWLVEHKTFPLKVLARNGARFGMGKFIDPVLADAAAQSGPASDLNEILEILFKSEDSLIEAMEKGEPWKGTAADLAAVIAAHPVASKLMGREFSTRGVGRKLSTLSKVRGSNVAIAPESYGGKHARVYAVWAPWHEPGPETRGRKEGQ